MEFFDELVHGGFVNGNGEGGEVCAVEDEKAETAGARSRIVTWWWRWIEGLLIVVNLEQRPVGLGYRPLGGSISGYPLYLSSSPARHHAGDVHDRMNGRIAIPRCNKPISGCL